MRFEWFHNDSLLQRTKSHYFLSSSKYYRCIESRLLFVASTLLAPPYSRAIHLDEKAPLTSKEHCIKLEGLLLCISTNVSEKWKLMQRIKVEANIKKIYRLLYCNLFSEKNSISQTWKHPGYFLMHTDELSSGVCYPRSVQSKWALPTGWYIYSSMTIKKGIECYFLFQLFWISAMNYYIHVALAIIQLTLNCSTVSSDTPSWC